MLKFKSIITACLLVLSTSIYAQTGIIKGTIKEAKTQDPAIGALVKVEGTTLGGFTDVEGNFEIKKVPAGVYKISISYFSFKNKNIENIRVEADKTTVINPLLEEDTKVLEQVVVRAQRTTNTEVAVISEIKQIQQIAVGISAQQIQKTQDRDASAVIRRVSGVSIFDERFIVVRGLNERYNTVLLNDIITPSTEVDVKSFSFDLIPSSAIDRILVYKSASADLPGDMGGGAIKIYTKTVPDGNSLSAGLSVSYRQNSTFQSGLVDIGGKTDAFGYDDGTRALPNPFPSRNNIISTAPTESTIGKFKKLSDYYNLEQTNLRPDIRGNINFSRRFFLGSKELTNISYLNYGFTSQQLNSTQARFNFRGETNENFADVNVQNNIRLGLMSNWAFIINPRNKIEFRNLFNQLANKETVLRNGTNFENNLEINNQAFRFEQRSIYAGQLAGTHELSPKTKLRWIGGLGYTFRLEPDFRRFTSSRTAGTNDAFQINLQQFESPTLQQAARFFSVMDEIVGTGTVNIERILGEKNEDDDNLTKKIKGGIYVENKDRLFEARWFGVVNPNRIGQDLLTKAPDAFFQDENFGTRKVFYSEGTNFDDKYAAQNLMGAAYTNAYLPFGEKFIANFGVRGEYNRQQLQSRRRGSGSAINVDNPVFNVLPSLNLSYKFNEKSVLRTAFSTTVNRPEFRELAPFTYYDFNFDVARRGNENLKNATIYNYDLRYDFSPSKSELISLGVFNKYFINPIEAALFYNGSTVAFTVENSKSAYSRGVELEVRKNFTKKFTGLFNASYIASDVKVAGINDQNRYLQGQSPYLINVGLFYAEESKGIQANILYNVIGPRIFVIGDNQLSANVFEIPRNVIDLNVTKSFGKHLEFKFSVQDVLNQPFKLVQDTDRNNKVTDTDGVYQSFRRGSYTTLGLNYKF